VTIFAGLLAAAAVVVFLFVLAVGFAAPATVGLALGRLLVRGDGRSFLGWLGGLVLGVLVVVLVAAIPVAGGWLEALLVLLGLGALLLTARPTRRVAEPTAVSPAGGAPGR
jgi:dolichol kinase